jgi:hypothetical protein
LQLGGINVVVRATIETKKVRMTEEEYRTLRTTLSYYEHTFKQHYKEMFVKDFMNTKVVLPNNVEEVLKSFSLDDIITVVYMNSFEVIATPEQKLLNYYEGLAESRNTFDHSRAKVVRDVLDILEINIKGINCEYCAV